MEIFLGKGGSGKTTLACATAIARVRAGERVLIASIDQAHSLGDVLGTRLAHDPGTTAGVQRVTDGLDAIEIDTLALLEQRYRELGTALRVGGSHDHGIDLGELDASELTGLPGVQELLGLAEIADLVGRPGDAEWDVVVVDTPASAETLRILAAPEMFLGYLERVWPRHRRVSEAIGTDFGKAMLVATVEKTAAAVAGIRELLADRERTSARLVTVPERVALAEVARTRSAAALHGLRVAAVVVNKVLPPVEPGATEHSAVRWYRNRLGEQLDVIERLRAAMPEVPVQTAQHTGPEPVGLSSLSAFSYAVDLESAGDGDGRTPPVTVVLESGEGVESVYAMRMHLPLADGSTLSLGRAEDDLIVGADGVRRRVRLASVLRRCVVTEAELDGETLVVRFLPDPKVWPA